MMKLARFVSIILLCLIVVAWTPVVAQVDNVNIELYYVSDEFDETNIFDDDSTTILFKGSKTYRIFLELDPRFELLEVFGNEDYPFMIQCTDLIWNNQDRGETYGYDIRASRLDENTVALDSWLTIGKSTEDHYGVLKSEDNDGSVVGGVNNDGGEAEIEGGLLINQSDEMGLALTSADGLQEFEMENYDIQVVLPDPDPESVFGSETVDSSYYSESFNMISTGDDPRGPVSSNRILLAQVTTAGELSAFNLNIVVRDTSLSAEEDKITLVGTQPASEEAPEIFSPFLKFPLECGCTDRNYLEYNPLATCDDGSCATELVIGCKDHLACNYNPDAHISYDELCCYPGRCNSLSIGILCPTLSVDEEVGGNSLKLYPNPASDLVNIIYQMNEVDEVRFSLINTAGYTIHENTIQAGIGINQYAIETSNLPSGMYLLKLSAGDSDRMAKVVIE